MSTTTSANMNLTIPVVSQEPGPTYAFDINSCLTTIDAHDHSSGKGVKITPAGMNISSDLSIGGNNITTMRTARFSAQVSSVNTAVDIGCLYVSGVDLYFNDTSGNQIRITQSAGVAGTPGSISNLTSPATASYSSANQTFVWQSAVNTAANLDCASIILRNTTVSSKGLTINPPSGMASNISMTLPAPPASQGFLGIDSSGNISSICSVTAGITSANIAAGTITNNNIANLTILAGNIAGKTITAVQIADQTISSAQIAASTISVTNMANTFEGSFTGGVYSNNASSFSIMVSGSVSVLQSSRPIYVQFSGNNVVCVPVSAGGVGSSSFLFEIHDGQSGLTFLSFQLNLAATGAPGYHFPPSSFSCFFVPGGGVGSVMDLQLRAKVISGSVINTNGLGMGIFQV